MKASGSIKLLTVSIFTVLISPAFSQEYDDMYFSHSDRKAEEKQNTEVVASNKQPQENVTQNVEQYGPVEDNYSSKNVNPDYIARYRDSKDITSDTTNNDSYYVEDYNRNNASDKNGSVINNYYYNSPYSAFGGYSPYYGFNSYNSLFMDPYWGFSPSWSFGLGYNYGFMPGLSMGLYFGNTWGYNPYYYNPWSYGYNPYAWDYPYYGYHSWYGYSCSPWYNPYFYWPYYGHHYASIHEYTARNVSYGRRSFRGSNYISGSTVATRGRQQVVASGSSPRTLADNTGLRNRVSSQRDYSSVQNEYYTRGRSGSGYSGNSSYGSGERVMSNNSRARSSESMQNTRTRVSPNTYYNYSRPTYRTPSRNSTPNNSYNYNRNSYSRPSSNSWNNSRSYSSSPRSSYSGGSSSRSSSSGFSSGSSSRSSGSSGGSSGFSRGGRGH